MPAMNVRQLIREEEPNYKNNIKYNITWVPNISYTSMIGYFLGCAPGGKLALIGVHAACEKDL